MYKGFILVKNQNLSKVWGPWEWRFRDWMIHIQVKKNYTFSEAKVTPTIAKITTALNVFILGDTSEPL